MKYYAIISTLALTCAFALNPVMPAQAAAEPSAKDSSSMGMTEAEKKAFEQMSALGENHKLLNYMNGSWTTKTTHIPDAPGAKPMDPIDGKCVTKSIMGGRFFQSEHTSSMMGKPMEGVATVGYDNTSGKFVSTWIDNFSTNIMYSTGTYDAATKTFTYICTMDDPMNPGKKFDMKEVIKIIDNDKHLMIFYSVKEGKETKFMEIVYSRAAS